MRLRDLENALSDVRTFGDPIVELEQYPTSAHLAAQVLHTADSSFDDIDGKAVCDLGCGTGMLSIGAALLGAQHVLGVDVDEGALASANENACRMEVSGVIDFCRADATTCNFTSAVGVERKFDTVIMNPPFGTKRKGADMAFLITAIQLSKGAVYSMHKTTTRDFILKKAGGWGAKAQVLAQLKFDISHAYRFHQATSVDVDVDLWRFDVASVPEDVRIDAPVLPPPDDLGDLRARRPGRRRQPNKGNAHQYRKQRSRR